jgi:hypothetical protein
MCVRSCDGFYFPLTNSPNGREGADEMCQALCPASQTRAFFIDRGGVDNATNSDGERYASIRNAYRFRREISASCGCRPAGQSWSKALQRAEDMITPGNDDIVVTEEHNRPLANAPLRSGAGPGAPVRPRGMAGQAIDPEPRDDGMLEPEPVPADPKGLVVLAPKPPPPPPPVVAPPAPRDPSKPVRVVGPGVNAATGRPEPIAKSQ